ncbi:MAG: DUF3368 domain-containing protein [Candidatus Latescibacterota bacterium]
MLGLRVSGTLGVLLLAKERAILHEVSPLLHRLELLRFRLGPHLRETVLRLAGETS